MTYQAPGVVLEVKPQAPESCLPQRILLALDSSDHANAATREALELAAFTNAAEIAGVHVYAARLHDMRFRQMEGGLPEQFREEKELERQREVHDSLITRGLSIITDSYLDQAEVASRGAGIAFRRRALEGKNYRELARETNSGNYDLLIMGAMGLGAVHGSRIGTVCKRVVRRSDIDTLVVKEPDRPIRQGPIMVAVDGSAKAYGGLMTALELARRWRVPVKVVAAFDPYYHYVAFNRIAGVLSEQAGKVFKFKDQEKLHEEIIDSGLAKIYEGHLQVAHAIAKEVGVAIETELLAGKPHDAIEKDLAKTRPSLLILGRLGIHADDGLDIGGNAEHLLEHAPCAIWLSMREYVPEVDVVAEVNTSWTHEAEARMERVPSFVRNMARLAILRYAQERGHTVITERIVEEATAQLMPGHAERAMREIVAAHDAGALKAGPAVDDTLRWTAEASALLLAVNDLAVRGNLSMRAEKKARQEKCERVEARHVEPFLPSETVEGPRSPETSDNTATLSWHAAALARLMRVPEGFMREGCRETIEQHAREHGLSEVTLDIAEEGVKRARAAMEASMKTAPGETKPKTAGRGCPFGHGGVARTGAAELPWTEEATALMQGLPAGMSRDMTRQAVAAIAARREAHEITADLVRQVLDTFRSTSNEIAETMPWDDDAREGLRRAPDMVRGALIREVERWAVQRELTRVDLATVHAVKEIWQNTGLFHLDPNDSRNRGE